MATHESSKRAAAVTPNSSIKKQRTVNYGHREKQQHEVAAMQRKHHRWMLNYESQKKDDNQFYYVYPLRHFTGKSVTAGSLDEEYDIVFRMELRCGQLMQRTAVKEAKLEISYQEDGKLCGQVTGSRSEEDNYKFEGNENEFNIVEYSEEAWNGAFDETPKGSMHLLTDRKACPWTLEEDTEDPDGPIPEVRDAVEADEFIAKQERLNDSKLSWLHNHTKLPDRAVSLIHQYSTSWKHPQPYFFLEKGDLLIKVVWEEDTHDGHCESHLIARKYSAAD